MAPVGSRQSAGLIPVAASNCGQQSKSDCTLCIQK
jgi:hypothetical protein